LDLLALGGDGELLDISHVEQLRHGHHGRVVEDPVGPHALQGQVHAHLRQPHHRCGDHRRKRAGDEHDPGASQLLGVEVAGVLEQPLPRGVLVNHSAVT